MICKQCPEAKSFGDDGIYCLQYGMILREGHECRLETGRRHENEKAADAATSAADRAEGTERKYTDEL